MRALVKLSPCCFEPSFERYFNVHNFKEWVDATLLFDDPVIDIFITNIHPALVLNVQSHHENLKLCPQLKDLHFLVDLHITVLSSHASVEHLVKKYEAIVALNGHF